MTDTCLSCRKPYEPSVCSVSCGNQVLTKWSYELGMFCVAVAVFIGAVQVGWNWLMGCH